MTSTPELYQLADELRSVAAQGLLWCENGYDRDRYERIMKASANIIAALEGGEPEVIHTRFMDNLYHVSPVACVEALVVREGKILLIQRSDDHLWAIPGGVAEVGETLAQAAERELWEEAGMHGQAVRLMGVFDSRNWKMRSKIHHVSAMFVVESPDMPGLHAPSDDSRAPTHETLGVGFFAENELPDLSQGHHLRVPAVFKMLRGEIETPYFDR